MKVDVHAHHIPAALIDRDITPPAGTIYGVRITEPGTDRVLKAETFQAVGFDPEQIYDLDRRLRDMRVQRIDWHVLSVPPFCFYYDLDPAAGLAVSRRFNDALAESARVHPDRFVALATLPLQAPDLAARELERAVRDLGLRGAEICSNVEGRNLDDPALAPVYSKLHELGVPVFIHPTNVLGQDRLSRYYLANLIGNPTDTAVAAASLIFGGILREFPRLKFYLAHAGGSCPYIRGRWEHGWRVRPEGQAALDRPPSEYFRLLRFDSLSHSVPALNFLAETAGPERIMLGTDYPFDMGDYQAVQTVASLAHLSDAQKDLIYGGNAAEWFRIG
ncbi:MAG TPA: amidohydrolase family protein [Dehalococcoidia bacterium]|nr:amidohydrolase family protein [Dehalococcoidia bacterium]